MFGNGSTTQSSDDNTNNTGANTNTSNTAEPTVAPTVTPTTATTTNTDDDSATQNSVSQTSQNPASLFTTQPVVDPFGTTAPEPKQDDNAPSEPPKDDLLNIKQQALQHLSPLVDHLEQSPEEKFKTTMMMIQASDDKNLIPNAFETAKQIEDDKFRAQAMLDIVNEINYFTQHNQ